MKDVVEVIPEMSACSKVQHVCSLLFFYLQACRGSVVQKRWKSGTGNCGIAAVRTWLNYKYRKELRSSKSEAYLEVQQRLQAQTASGGEP